MLFRKDRKILNQKVMIENRDKLIKDLQEESEILIETTRGLKFENEELVDFKRKVITIMTEKGTIVSKYDKINELVNNLQAGN